MKFSLYSKKNVLDEMQEQTMSKIERRGGYGAVGPGLWLLDGRCVYWCFDRSALLCTAPILCISGEEEPEKAGR